MRKYLVLASICFGSHAFAVLPPLYQGKKEIETILTHPQFGENLQSGDILQQITKTSTGYLVITNKRILPITVRYQSQRQVGPAPFSLEFQRAIELEPVVSEKSQSPQRSQSPEEKVRS